MKSVQTKIIKTGSDDRPAHLVLDVVLDEELYNAMQNILYIYIYIYIYI